MSSNAPWSVKGIDPKAREVAKDLARRSGKTLGEWLNEVIIEGGIPGGEPDAKSRPAEASDEADRGPYREVMRDLSRQAARETMGSREAYRDFAYDEPQARPAPAAEGGARRPTASLYPEPPRRGRYEDSYGGDDELSRVTRAMERLSSRIEAAENRSTVAITGIDQSVVNVLTRLDHVERDHTSIAARFEGGLEEVRHTQRNVNERLRLMEESDQGPRQAEALRSLEAALGKIAGQLYDGQQQTTQAIGEIRQGVREELTQGEYRTRAAVGELREEINDSEQRTRAAFGVLREELGEREMRIETSLDQLRDTVAETDQVAREQSTAVRQDITALAARVERTEQRQAAAPLLPPRPTADPAIVVEQVVARVTHRLEQAESKTSEAVRSLQASFAGLDQRLRSAESSLDPEALRSLQASLSGLESRVLSQPQADPDAERRAEMRLEALAAGIESRLQQSAPQGDPQAERRTEARFESLAADLARSVEDARAEMAERLNASADSLFNSVEQVRADIASQPGAPTDNRRVEELEKAVRELTGHVEAAEKRSAEAIERMGREVMRVTEAVTTRVSSVEAESVGAVDRVTTVIEKRLARADTTQAEALDRLGDEMGRLSERLAERVDASERRSAEAIEEVGDKVAGVAERLNEKFERTAESLSERMRQGEERSQRMLEETRERLDHRLSQAERGLSERVEARISETQRVVSEVVEQRIIDAQRGVVDKVEQRVSEVQRGLTSTVEQRLAENHRGMVETVEQRVGDVQRGLTSTVEQRLAETQRGMVETVEQRVGDVQRGFASTVEQRFGETQRSLAEVTSRMSQVESAAPESRADYSATVFTPPADVFLEPEHDLAPFGVVAAEEPEAQPEPSDGFRRTPLEPDVFVEDVHAAAYEPAFEPEPVDIEPPQVDVRSLAAAAAPSPVLATAAFAEPDDPFGDAFEAADEFVSAIETPAPQAFSAPEPTYIEPDPIDLGPVDMEPADMGPADMGPADIEPADMLPADLELADLAPLDTAPMTIAPMDLAPLEPAPLDLPAPRASTRDMLEQARAAAKAASAEIKGKGGKDKDKGKAKFPPLPSVTPSGLKDLGPPPPMAGLKTSGLRGPSLGGLLSNLRKGKKDEREGGMRTFALVAGTSFAVGLAGTGWMLLQRQDDGASAPDGAAGRPAGRAPLAASALVVGSATGGAAAPRAAAAAPAADSPAGVFAAAVRQIEGGEAAAGVAALRRSADQGHAPAQFYLAKLYENGEGGLARNAAQARTWTERAASGGDRKAMHNLALFYFSGDGGERNMSTAAQWFRRAADQGLVDSQYNLGRLYEEGFGVATNPAEAYKWYLIAGRAGDGEARTSAERIKRQLSAEAQATAQRSAIAFKSQAPGANARASGGVMADGEVAAAQRALSELGFYKGPADGRSSPALRRAIAAWQRQQGLAPTGSVSGDTLARLAATAG